MSDTFKHVSLGYEVRRVGAKYVGGFPSEDRRPLGIVVERFPHPQPKFPLDGTDADKTAWATQKNAVDGIPAQIAVYWQDTKQVERMLETDVLPNYPGGGCYRAWDREFPLFAVETGGYGDISVLTPDGEAAVFDMPEPSDASTEDYVEHVIRVVRSYLTKTVSDVVDEPIEPDTQEQFENAEYENAG